MSLGLFHLLAGGALVLWGAYIVVSGRAPVGRGQTVSRSSLFYWIVLVAIGGLGIANAGMGGYLLLFGQSASSTEVGEPQPEPTPDPASLRGPRSFPGPGARPDRAPEQGQ